MKISALLTSFLIVSVTGIQARTWTSASGHKVEAELVRVEGPNVVVRLPNGTESPFPIAQLSEADQAFLKQAPVTAPAPTSKPAEPSKGPATVRSTTAESSGEAKKAWIGTWDGYMADSDGSKHGDIRLEITEEKIIASNPQGNRVMGAGTYQISGSRIDATGTEGQFSGKKYEGIFELDGKTLKWCSANDNPRSQRPSKLQTQPQAGQFLMVLEKTK